MQFLRRCWWRLVLWGPLTKLYDLQGRRRAGNKALGDRGEREAERFLLRLGWIVIERSYEDQRGEIDLIAVDGRTIVFVEVKTRRSVAKGHPAEAVDAAKRRQISQTAVRYAKRNDLLECSLRFDVIAIIWPDANANPQLAHYRGAFDAPR